MLTACEVTETAIRLCLHLHVELIPEDYHRTGEYRQVMARVVAEYTNYDTLRDALPSCPPECPIAARAGLETGAACFNYHLARDILQTEARRRALVMFAACEPWAVGAV
jgi:hypothetical protein